MYIFQNAFTGGGNEIFHIGVYSSVHSIPYMKCLYSIYFRYAANNHYYAYNCAIFHALPRAQFQNEHMFDWTANIQRNGKRLFMRLLNYECDVSQSICIRTFYFDSVFANQFSDLVTFVGYTFFLMYYMNLFSILKCYFFIYFFLF